MACMRFLLNMVEIIPYTMTYFGFTFYQVDPKWRWLADMGKMESAKEVALTMAGSGVRHRTYSTLGLRADSEFMVWSASEDIEDIQKLASRLYGTILGKYITPSLNYISQTRPSEYTPEAKAGAFLSGQTPKKYAIVYPFTKTREWYLLRPGIRQAAMNEHIAVSRKHPNILLNTTYSLGLDDQDFMLAFETDDLGDFQNLIMELRQTEVSRYVQSDTPMMVCIHKNMESIIEALG